MSDPVVTVARFTSSLEAEMAKNYLETHGIAAHVAGDKASSLHFGALGGLAQLYVRDSDADRAAELLAELLEKAELKEDWRDRAEDDPDYWICPLCGASVGKELEICDACETQREGIQSTEGITGRRRRSRRKPADPATEIGIMTSGETTSETPKHLESTELELDSGELDPEIEAPDIRLYPGDAIAARAFLGAILGLLCGGFTIYSTVLLLRLAFNDFDLSTKGKVYCYGALGVVVLQFCLLLLMLYGRP